MPHSVLAVDEVGYLSYDARCAYLLFEVVTRRYREKSIVISTEKIPDERVDHLRAVVKTLGVRVYRFDIRFDGLDAWRAERARKTGAPPA